MRINCCGLLGLILLPFVVLGKSSQVTDDEYFEDFFRGLNVPVSTDDYMSNEYWNSEYLPASHDYLSDYWPYQPSSHDYLSDYWPDKENTDNQIWDWADFSDEASGRYFEESWTMPEDFDLTSLHFWYYFYIPLNVFVDANESLYTSYEDYWSEQSSDPDSILSGYVEVGTGLSDELRADVVSVGVAQDGYEGGDPYVYIYEDQDAVFYISVSDGLQTFDKPMVTALANREEDVVCQPTLSGSAVAGGTVFSDSALRLELEFNCFGQGENLLLVTIPLTPRSLGSVSFLVAKECVLSNEARSTNEA